MVEKICLPVLDGPWPIIGNLNLFSPHPHRDLQTLAKRYGPIFRLRLGSKEAIVVSSPKVTDEVLASRPKIPQFTLLLYDCQDLVAAPYGPHWRYARKVFTLELLTSKKLQEFQEARKQEALCSLHSFLAECKGGKVACLKDTFDNLAMNIVTKMMMNKNYFGAKSNATNSSEATVVKETLGDMFRLSAVFNLGDYFPFLQPFDLMGYGKEMRACSRKTDDFYKHIIDEHRQRLQSSYQQDGQKEVMDLVDVLLTRPTGMDEKPLTDTQIKGILQDVVIAGTETTSGTLEWVLTELLRNPDVMKKPKMSWTL